MTTHGARELSRQARRLYSRPRGLLAWMQVFRPYICPFEELLPLVPAGARVLDAGCGAGLFLGLLAECGRIGAGHGFDSSAAAVELARRMQEALPAGAALRMEHRDAAAAWPDGQFDVVCLIDVLHHVPVASRAAVVRAAAERLLPHGFLLCKEMVVRPRWRAWCNQLHDLVLARQWIRHVAPQEMELWAGQAGLRLVHRGAANRLCYGHEWWVYRRMGK